ncbi:unnamed protein product, partial [Didymodactylos carnosus]
CLNGWAGAYLHVSFPVITRASFGMIGNCFVVVSRGFLAIIWGAVQTYIGSECIKQMINAIWPSFQTFPNHLPKSAKITSAGLLSFLIYFLIQLPFVLMPMRKIKWLFVVKTIVMPIATITILVWALKTAGGTGPILAQPGVLEGRTMIWAWLSSLNSVLGSFATLSCNIGDFTRFARKPSNTWIQALIIPFAFSAFGLIGILVSSASAIIYNEGIIWDPTILIGHFDSRVAKFFAAFTFALATLGTNISANTISAANDLSAMFPKIFNIRRGSFVASLLAWICVPWYILSSAEGFLAFMSSYSIFLGPIAGIMVSDFWLVRHVGRIQTPELYRPHGKYWYWKGWHWRAYVSLICGTTPNLPGFLHQISQSIKVGNAIYIFYVGWLNSFIISLSLYWLLWKIWPAHDIGEAILVDDVIDSNDGIDKNKTINETVVMTKKLSENTDLLSFAAGVGREIDSGVKTSSVVIAGDTARIEKTGR